MTKHQQGELHMQYSLKIHCHRFYIFQYKPNFLSLSFVIHVYLLHPNRPCEIVYESYTILPSKND